MLNMCIVSKELNLDVILEFLEVAYALIYGAFMLDVYIFLYILSFQPALVKVELSIKLGQSAVPPKYNDDNNNNNKDNNNSNNSSTFNSNNNEDNNVNQCRSRTSSGTTTSINNTTNALLSNRFYGHNYLGITVNLRHHH